MFSSHKKLTGAFLFGFALIVFALIIRITTNTPIPEGGVAIVSESNLPREYVEVTDKDNDGIPDWQEALQRTEPVTISTNETNYDRPETLTDQFAVDFFQDMVLAKNYGAFGADESELVENATEDFAEKAKDELLGSEDINIITDNSPARVKIYANQLAQIVLDNSLPVESPSELEILKRAYTTNNPEALKELDPLIAMYKDMLDRSLNVPVPSLYVKEHLDLVNVYNALYNDIKAMKSAFSDPLYTMVRLKRYEEDASTLYVALLNLQKKMLVNGVIFTASDPAYRFIIK